MIRRDGQSEFVDGLEVGKRGTILKVASCGELHEEKQNDGPGADTKPEAENVIKKFDKSPEIPQTYIDEHLDRIKGGEDAEVVMKDFFKGLQKAKGASKKLSIRTAKAFRQCGIFKMAENNVYQDMESGDFWKISEDGKSVVRMFKETEGVTEGV